MHAVVKPQGCTNLKLHQLGRRVARLYDDEVRALGLRHTQYALLSSIVKRAPLTQTALASALGLSASTLTRNLRPMVAAGWISVQPGADARSHVVLATPAGRALREQAQRAWKRSQMALNERLGEARVAALHAVIDECLGLLAAKEDGDE